MDVGDLFQLQRTFHRDRKHQPAAEEQRIRAFHQTLGKRENLLIQTEDGLDDVG